MLLIHCPYCKEKLPELEFEYAGQAHIARPLNLLSRAMLSGGITCSSVPMCGETMLNSGAIRMDVDVISMPCATP